LKRTLFVLCLLFAGSTFAKDWHPFVGTGVIVEFPESGKGNSFLWCSGTQFEAGVRMAHWEYYLAYRLANSLESALENFTSLQAHDTVDILTDAYDSRSRSEKWILAGIRYWPLPLSSKMAPWVGLSIGTGRSKIWHNTRYTEYEFLQNGGLHLISESWVRDDLTSSYCAEVDMEVGVSFRVFKTVDILALSQYQAWFIGYKFRDNGSDLNETSLKMSALPSLALQLRYTFGE
jgi:hypothetical protein